MALALAIGLVVGIGLTRRGLGGSAEAQADDRAQNEPAGAANGAGAQPGNNPAANSGNGGAAAPGGGAGLDLRKGAVFLQSNDATANEVVAFARAEDGRLSEVGRYATGGAGSGSFEDSAQGMVLGTSNGEASPQHNVDSAQMLFVTNAGSNTVTVFRVNADGLEQLGSVQSGGEKPVSLTVNRGLLYVLNSGELDDRYILERPLESDDQLLNNCTHGEPPTITGFRVTPAGELAPIEDSTRALSGGQASGCAQVSFSPDGKHLVVTERYVTLPGKPANQGAIVVFDMNDNGTPGAKVVTDSSGAGPFGFTFTRDGTLLVSENNFSEEEGSHVSSYSMRDTDLSRANLAPLRAISKSVPNQATDACWVVVTSDGRRAFTANAFGGGTISSYGVDENGALTLMHSSATAQEGKSADEDSLSDGTTDLGLSRDNKYLYQPNSIMGVVHVFALNDNGTLSFIEEHKVFDVPSIETTGEAAPYGISVF